MPPTLEKLKGHIGLGLSVHACLRPSMRPLQNLLRYSSEISYGFLIEKIIDTYFFQVWIIPLCGVMPLFKDHNEIL